MSKGVGAEQLAGSAPPETARFGDVDNAFVLVSHGTHHVPTERYSRIADGQGDGRGAGELSRHFTRDDELFARDGSDFAVGAIGRHLQGLNRDIVSTPPLAGRMFINPNGSRDVAIQVRKTTFGDVPIWNVTPDQSVQDRMAEEVWDTYHARVQAAIEMQVIAADRDVHTLVVDIHDTDTHVLNEQGEWVNQPLDDDGNSFPLLLVSDQDGRAAHPTVTHLLGQELLGSLVRHGVIEEERAIAEGLSENFIYKGGFTTQRYGMDLPNAYLLRGDEDLQNVAQHLHFVQIELNRTMYLTADRSDIDQEKMARTQEAVAEALAVTARQIRQLELGEWRNVPALGSKEHFSAMGMPLLAATEWYEKDGVRKARPLQFS